MVVAADGSSLVVECLREIPHFEMQWAGAAVVVWSRKVWSRADTGASGGPAISHRNSPIRSADGNDMLLPATVLALFIYFAHKYIRYRRSTTIAAISDSSKYLQVAPRILPGDILLLRRIHALISESFLPLVIDLSKRSICGFLYFDAISSDVSECYDGPSRDGLGRVDGGASSETPRVARILEHI
jgi:hypothetical protein